MLYLTTPTWFIHQIKELELHLISNARRIWDHSLEAHKRCAVGFLKQVEKLSQMEDNLLPDPHLTGVTAFALIFFFKENFSILKVKVSLVTATDGSLKNHSAFRYWGSHPISEPGTPTKAICCLRMAINNSASNIIVGLFKTKPHITLATWCCVLLQNYSAYLFFTLRSSHAQPW